MRSPVLWVLLEPVSDEDREGWMSSSPANAPSISAFEELTPLLLTAKLLGLEPATAADLWPTVPFLLFQELQPRLLAK